MTNLIHITQYNTDTQSSKKKPGDVDKKKYLTLMVQWLKPFWIQKLAELRIRYKILVKKTECNTKVSVSL